VVALAFAVPGRLDQPTGGYAYDRRVIAELRRRGCDVDIVDLGEGFPRPTDATIREALARLRQVPAGRPIVIDGLALGVLPEAAAVLRATHPVIALVHHPLALEAGLTREQARAMQASERAALAAARHVVVTSAATARLLAADYGVVPQAITIALPGNDRVWHGASAPSPRLPSGRSRPSSAGYGEGRGEGPSPQAQTRGEAPSPGAQERADLSPHSPSKTGVDALMLGRGEGGGHTQSRGPQARSLKLLAVGAVVRRKGYDVLIEALARLTDLDWQLVIAGDCTRDRETAGALATRLVVLRLGARITMTGAVSEEELAALYRDADVFVLASRHEGYGMAFAEAIAHGLPVIGTKAGAIPETVPDGAGILVPPDDVGALAAALRAMIGDAALRERCAAAARRAALLLPTWEATAEIFLGVLKAVT
jgi:glycosyltransferase involved in cell wall biosynthesis